MIKFYSKIKYLVFVMYFCSACFVFVSSSFAQNFRNPNVHLEVKMKDKIVTEKDLVSINLKEKIQFQVSKNGKDVTTDKKIHYQVLTPWSLTVSPEGLVEGKYPSRTDNIPANNSSNHGMISITYGHVGENEVGSQFVNFFVDFSGTSKSFSVNDESKQVSSMNDVHKVDEADIKNSNAVSVSKPVDFSTIDTFKEDVPADILESLNNREIQNKNTSSESESQPADFIDYDQLRKMQNTQPSILPTKPKNSSLELTPEERQLYDDALKQP